MSHIFVFFFFNDTATTEIYTLSLHDALPISPRPHRLGASDLCDLPGHRRGAAHAPHGVDSGRGSAARGRARGSKVGRGPLQRRAALRGGGPARTRAGHDWGGGGRVREGGDRLTYVGQRGTARGR